MTLISHHQINIKTTWACSGRNRNQFTRTWRNSGNLNGWDESARGNSGNLPTLKPCDRKSICATVTGSGVYIEFRAESIQQSGLAWGAILKKMFVLAVFPTIQCSVFRNILQKWFRPCACLAALSKGRSGGGGQYNSGQPT